MSSHNVTIAVLVFLFTIFCGVKGFILIFILTIFSIFGLFFLVEERFFHHRDKNKLWLFFIIVLLILAYARGSVEKKSLMQYETLENFAKCRVSFEGRLIGDLVVEDSRTIAIMETERVYCKNSKFLGKVRLRIVTPHYIQTYTEGDRFKVVGTLSVPEAFEGDTGRIFQYDMYLAKDGIFGIVSYAYVEVITPEKSFFRSIFIFKNMIVSSLHHTLPYPIDGLVIGMILGVDGALDARLEDYYRRAGLIHIVVLSGFNVTIIAEAIRRTMPFGLRTNLTLAFFGIWVFAIMVGASATVIRATIMATIVLFVRGLKEDYSVFHSLWIAALIMALVNPLVLVYDPSFHLSFLATCGIVYLSPIFEKYFNRIPNTMEMRFTICGTLATQVFVFPYLAYAMGEISIAAFFVNVVTVSFVPFIMLGGFVLSIVNLLIPSFSLIFIWVLDVLVNYQLTVVEFAARLPHATIALPVVSVGVVCIIYIGICMLTFFLRKIMMRDIKKK